ncbi:hypothetical protein VP01_8510g2 [Puccinia sorghi]|uniref:GAG-pre-integrase domain-containing protein n=1 Tax=Puccinia sorghi TaxID=27349 RepID=A0A0L6U945_9BASI|nr:hypothetical protein VP01_8510g2 [Puccinia sorghi]
MKVLTGGHIHSQKSLAGSVAYPSLISIPQLFKHKFSIRKTAYKGANILIDNHFQLIGSLKNNLLELQYFHFEAIKSLSACCQSSPDSPNWHARLGHPNQKYKTLIVPQSKLINCSVLIPKDQHTEKEI